MNPAPGRARTAAWQAANPDRVRANGRAYRTANSERLRDAKVAWAKANPEKRRAICRRYYKAHPERIRVSAAKSRAAHPETQRAARIRQRAERRAACARWRAALRNAPVNDLTATQWEEIKKAYGFRCVYCGRKMQRLTQDHITPLIAGGSHTVSNIVPACLSCNSKKGKGAVLVPVQPLLLTITPAKKHPL